jgi:DNA replication protein DnaC
VVESGGNGMMEVFKGGRWSTPTILHDKISQELVDAVAEKMLADWKAAGVPEEEVTELDMELRGGNCPWCKKPWLRKHASGDLTKRHQHKVEGKIVETEEIIPAFFGEFDYWIPNCYCYAKHIENITHYAQQASYLDGKLAEMRIPKSEWRSTFANWDWSVREEFNANVKTIQEWSKGNDWKEGKGLILFGAVGTGKTRCAIMAARDIIEREPDRRIKFLAMADLLTAIISNQQEGGYIEALLSNEIIIVDDLDKIPTDKEWARGQVFGFYDACLRENVTLIGTTNLNGAEEMLKKFDYAIVSRLVGKCKFLGFSGAQANDYRIIRRKYEMK